MHNFNYHRAKDVADAAGLLGKTDKDSKEDFGGGYDFDDMFVKPFLPSKKPAAHKPRPPSRKEKPKETV